MRNDTFYGFEFNKNEDNLLEYIRDPYDLLLRDSNVSFFTSHSLSLQLLFAYGFYR